MLLFMILLSQFAFVIGDKSFTLVLDISASMKDEMCIIQENIAQNILRTISNENIKNYILVPYSDPKVGPIVISLTQDGLVDSLKGLNIIWEGKCPEITLKAVENALEASKPESYIYVFTDAQPKDGNQLDNIQRLCRRKRSQVFIFVSGKCLDDNIAMDSESVYLDVAKSCNGSVFNLDIRNLNKAFSFIKDISNVDWTEVNTPNEFENSKQFMFSIDSYTENVIAAVSCQTPVFVITDDLNKQPSVQEIMVTPRALAVNIKPEIGSYTINVTCQGPATATFFRRKIIKFEYGFSPKIPSHIRETTSRPLPDVATNIFIALPENTQAEINAITLQCDGQETRELNFRALDEVKPYYIAESILIPDYSCKILIFCTDRTNNVRVTGQSDIIRIQQLEPNQKLVNPSAESTFLAPPLIDYGKKYSLSCKVVGDPKPEIWWEDENGGKLPSEDALLELPYIYISYVTIENAAKNGTFFCKSKNSKGENTVIVEYYVNRTYSFDVVQYPSDYNIKKHLYYTTIEYGYEGKLYCEVNAYPEAETKWYHNDTLIEYSENILFVPEEHMLLISRMTLEDTGEYKCEVSNEVETRTFRASVYIADLEQPQVGLESTEIILNPNDSKEIICRVVQGTPIPEVKWHYKSALGDEYDDDMPEGVTVVGTKVEIDSASVQHAGIYVCEATNILGIDVAEVTVKVQYAPKIKNGDEVKIVKKGHPVSLVCDVDAVPPAFVHWDMYQDDVIIAFDERHYTDEDHTHHFIAGTSDSGMYHCIAKNIMGEAMRTVTVNVLVKPYIQPVKSRFRVRSGDSVRVPCNVLEGNPVPSTRMEFTDRNTIKTVLQRDYSDKAGLFIASASKRDEGTYQCVAESTAGIDTITFYLKVD